MAAFTFARCSQGRCGNLGLSAPSISQQVRVISSNGCWSTTTCSHLCLHPWCTGTFQPDLWCGLDTPCHHLHSRAGGAPVEAAFGGAGSFAAGFATEAFSGAAWLALPCQLMDPHVHLGPEPELSRDLHHR